ncbi:MULTISPECIES: rhomboid family intramembrane serine protease [Providencia]|uniref:rhomboid family intramembrane serine protease n=1 Tax=Providencia TaxID=586 RepID=UPI00101218DD|nr:MULTISPECIES: rhomboid family intramembrane serine protease [Providencia]MBC8654165.1 rhomboid family intramembrane serine protease [Providencia vermicola]EJD6583100.1 rhomboid family intramembrane serine protease [Providencia rettgeri]EJD6614219.1 rhomboid family intramembrane serine protease [Providencia rettgeri]ELL9150798.1 rhomboid family intramembrane serine protease [Providencia rettgeri]ELR5133608.1 rhomboid family intramembrane serine protease [Providencia rettgeri]
MTGDLNAATVQKPKFSLWAIALTLCIAVLNIVVYFYQLNYAAPLDSQENNLLLFGANVYQLSLTGDWWRYPVSMVLHSGGMHLALNTLALFVIGIECERNYGKFRMLAIYLFSGIGAAFFSAYWQYQEALKEVASQASLNTWSSLYLPDNTVYITVSIGASGAIMGLAAASVIYLLKAINNPALSIEQRNQLKRPLYNIMAMIGLTLVNGLQSGIDNAAHIGGAVLGAFISGAFVLAPQATNRGKFTSSILITLIAAILLFFALNQYSSSEDEELNYERQFIYQEMEKELNQWQS